MRLHVFEKIKGIILAEWPHAQVNVFGSFCTNLYLPTNDIDIVVTGEWVKLPLFTLEEAFLKADLAVEDSIVVLDKTAVPIIKFIDKETEVKVDISFNHVNGLYCVEQIRQYINQYSLLPPLMMVIKQYLSQRQLNEVYYGGINSYSLVLMIVSFFQLHPRGEPATNLGVLLIEFFELYGRQFNYTKVGISLLDGGCYFPKDMLDNGSEAGLLYIQDPLEPTENASRGCYGIMHVRQSFDHAFSILHKAILTRESSLFAKPSLLSRIIQINEEVHEYRDWVKSRWPSSSSPPPFYLPMPTIMSPIPLMSPPGPFIIVPNTFQEEHTTPVEANGERALVYS
jgi:non-canonical poly(A) RNA polymerase PAPD5/7